MILAQGCKDQNTFCFELYVMYTFEFITTTAHSGLRKREVVAVFYTAVGVTTFNSLLSPLGTCMYAGLANTRVTSSLQGRHT